MSLAKATRKLKRRGKSAVQFRISSTFEFIELECKGTWRPDKLRVVWFRNHRKVKSNDTMLVVSEDFGPNGAKGRAVFSPAISVSLVVTLYRDANQTDFEEKEYKYYVEHDGPGGKKILATFNCNVSEFVGIPTTKQALDLNFKCVSKKVKVVNLGITLESQFMKEGGALDDDMQSTFSAMSAGQESTAYDEEDDDEGEEDEQFPLTTPGGNRLSVLEEEKEESEESNEESMKSVVLGTGQHLKRFTIPRAAPAKPPRTAGEFEDLSASDTHVSRAAESSNPDVVKNSNSDLSNEASALNPDLSKASNPDPGKDPKPMTVVMKDTEAAGNDMVRNGGAELVAGSVEPVNQPEVVGDELGVQEGAKVGYVVGPKVAEVKAIQNRTEANQEVAAQKQKGAKAELKEDVGVQKGAEAKRDLASQNGAEAKRDLASQNGAEAKRDLAAQNGAKAGDQEVVGAKVTERQKSAKQISKERAKSITREEGAKVTKNDARADASDDVLWNEEQKDATNIPELEEVKLIGVGSGVVNEPVERQSVEEPETVAAAPTETNGDVGGVDAYGREIRGSGHYDPLLEMARSFASVSKANGIEEEPEDITQSTQSRWTAIESRESYKSPSIGIEDDEEEEAVPPTPTEAWLDRNIVLVDCFGEVVDREKMDQANLIGLYFSAGWCPPCRRFLPKLVKFYHHLKQHGKSLKIIYISSDYTEQDMMKYMKEQQMPWVAISYEGNTAENFRKKFNVAAVPLLKILSRTGEVVEESAKKSVEGASHGSAILKLYNKWHEKLMGEEGEEGGSTRVSANLANKEKKGLLSKVKASMHSIKKDSDVDNESESFQPKSPESGRRVVDNRGARKVRGSKNVSQEVLDEKEERIHHLEEVNRTLKQTNDELSEELGELRQKLDIVTAELEQTKSASKTLQDESRELIANLNMRGWLFKRGVRGFTASVWRRRYFRLDQGSKLYYYKNSSEGNPQGFVDIDKVIGVQEVTASQQDKNHATFTVQCDGRTFQLQAHDEANMRKWIEAIAYMTSWRKKNSRAIADEL